ncbi:MAG: primosomal replication protein N [Gammaproteobacteria bacterium]|nr:primosomal replication protein N [Gammaproteobacteria bacterium]
MKLDKLRKSPAGVPHQTFTLEHRSKQMEAGFAREVRCQIVVQVSGDALQSLVLNLKQGTWLRVSGFIARTSYRSEPCQIILHAQTIDFQAA